MFKFKRDQLSVKYKLDEYLQLCSYYSITPDITVSGICTNISTLPDFILKHDLLVGKINKINDLIRRKTDFSKNILDNILNTANLSHKIGGKFYCYALELFLVYSPNTSLNNCYRKISSKFGVSYKTILNSICSNLSEVNHIIQLFLPDYRPTKSNNSSVACFFNCMYFQFYS